MKVLITGASSGVGEELVKQFAKDCNNDIVAISRDMERLNQIKQYCFNQYQNKIHIYLSAQYKTLPAIFPSLFYCMSGDEFKEWFKPKSKKDIGI